MIAWMIYATLIGVLLALGAHAAERLGRLAGLRVRWVWIAAIAGVLVLSATARRGEDVVIAPTVTTTAAPRVAPKSEAGWVSAVTSRLAEVRQAVDDRLRSGMAVAQQLAPRSTAGYIVAAWAVVSAALLLLVVGVSDRFRRARRAWPRTSVQGVDVRVAPQVGPVVIGFVQPEIVVPRWLLGRSPDDQRLVVAHEDEHVRARDPLLLGIAWLAVIAAPWNPALWYMLSRLRLAVELDCDARVLRRGATPRSYGSLLIDVAANASGLRLSALALADQSSHLHQRILAMRPGTPRFAFARAAAAAALGLVAILAACEAHMPTAAEISDMDAAGAEQAAVKLSKLQRADTTVAFVVDGKEMSALKARAIVKDSIASIEVVTTAGRAKQIRLSTKNGFVVRGRRSAPDNIVLDTFTGTSGTSGTSDTAVTIVGHLTGVKSATGGTPVIFIDGAHATQAQMNALNPKSIESIEVLKGAAAAATYGPDAKFGVITIKMKAPGSPD